MITSTNIFCSASLATGLVLLAACRPQPTKQAPPPAPPAPSITYHSTRLGGEPEAKPWITHVAFADLDRDGLLDGLACDSARNAVIWLRQNPTGIFTESDLATELPAPVHVTPADLDADGDLDLLLACMGRLLPSNDRIGAVIVLENTGGESFQPRWLVRDTARVTDVQAGDFNGDGRLDLAVAKFGYYEGEVTWLENRGDWTFQEHALLNLPGAINVCVADFDGDKRPDIAALVSQQYEEVHLFTNRGSGQFSTSLIFGSTNEDFGSSGLSVCDVNRDGRPDLLYTNGDGFDYADPGKRPWHGLQWLENTGAGGFRQHRVGNFPGAYSPVGADIDADDDIDLVCVSGFNDWDNPRAVSFMAYLNDGRGNFTPYPLANSPTHLISVAAADLDNDGRPELLTGGFHAYPPWDRVSRVLLWRPTLPPALAPAQP